MMNSRWNNSSALLSVAAISALALSSCAADDMDSDEEEAQPTATVTETVEAESTDSTDAPETDSTDEPSAEAEPTDEATSSPGAGGEEGVYQAVDAVNEEYPDAVVLDMDTEGSAYEFTIFEAGSEWELDVDRETFEISNTQEDDIDGDDQRDAEAVEIDFADALRTASEESGGSPEQADLSEDNGTVTWEIELDNGTEVHVDVASGDVDRVDN
ncbi:PepSY domain-containing protein [Nesterenkonia sp. Act20]|uniref:PepSY domain-containing protein n=1 Tax=Nesterenkonia sp. Act20 TaxID=1483432 RepID=UPI001C43BBDA|nr:PepSY domain-containing protein [Nesterenkonia sp. Act20]